MVILIETVVLCITGILWMQNIMYRRKMRAMGKVLAKLNIDFMVLSDMLVAAGLIEKEEN